MKEHYEESYLLYFSDVGVYDFYDICSEVLYLCGDYEMGRVKWLQIIHVSIYFQFLFSVH